MKGLRSTIALIVVLGGLAAYIYFVTWKTPEGGDTAKKTDKVFAGVQADKIEEIRISTSGGDATTVKKDNATWQVVQPVAAKADETEVSGITSALATTDIVRVIDENPSSLTDYGLSNPRIEVDFKAAGDKDYRKLLIGEKSPTGSDLFAKRNDEKRVFLIPAFQESTFNKDTFALRDKVVLKFDRDKVDGVEVDAAGKTLVMAKDGADWKIRKPLETRADYGSVEGLIGRVQTVQMKSIAADQATPADLKKYGLEKPEATVNVNAGSARATLLIGGKATDTTVYARDASKPAVVTIESALMDDLKKGADDYRRKDLFEFRAYNANRVELIRGKDVVVFERVKGQGENAQDKWRRVSPNAGDADRDKVDAMLAKLANMRATSFVDGKGALSPSLEVHVKFDDGKKEERVTFVKDGADVLVLRPGEPGAAKTDAADLTETLKSLDELSK
jgi:Domain of unknown function (DUF4340)